MDHRVVLRGRIAKVLSAITLNDPVLTAFRAAYEVYCAQKYLGESAAGPGTLASVKGALEVALQDRTVRRSMPANVKEKAGTQPTVEFRRLLVEAARGLDAAVVDAFLRVSAPLNPIADPDEVLAERVHESLWSYIERAENTDVF